MTVMADLPAIADLVVPQTPCASCRHVRAFHSGGTNCRMGGCLCDEFKVSFVEDKPEPRRVVFDSPDGYMLTVSLIPYTDKPAQSEPTDGD